MRHAGREPIAPVGALCDERGMPDPEARSGSATGAFLFGCRTAATSVFALVITVTYIGFGALCHDYGFTVVWAMASTALQWAGPAQVILVTTLAAGAAPLEIAVAVGLSSVRLLPIVVALLPLVRGERTRPWQLVVPVHFMAVSVWIEAMRHAPCAGASARPSHRVLQRRRGDIADPRRGRHGCRVLSSGGAAGPIRSSRDVHHAHFFSGVDCA
jgi:hypothetical protein